METPRLGFVLTAAARSQVGLRARDGAHRFVYFRLINARESRLLHRVVSSGQPCALRGIEILTVGWALLCRVSKLYE